MTVPLKGRYGKYNPYTCTSAVTTPKFTPIWILKFYCDELVSFDNNLLLNNILMHGVQFVVMVVQLKRHWQGKFDKG